MSNNDDSPDAEPTSEPHENTGGTPGGAQDAFEGMTTEEAYREGQAVGQRLAAHYQSVGGGTITSRSDLASRTQGDTQFGGKRDLYKTLGYGKRITIDNYLEQYLRGDIAKRIVNAPADKTWSEWPEITDDDEGEEESDFEEAVRSLQEDVHALKALRDADRYSGIGHVGALVIGFADGNELKEEVNTAALSELDVADAIPYLTPCHEKALKSITLVDDPQDPRFGEPDSYEIDFSEMDALSDSAVTVTNERRQRTVHHTRVILVDYERPRLEPVMNRLFDLEKVTGASAELFWRGADYGLALNLDADAAGSLGTTQRRELQEDIESEAEAYYHGLQPFLQVAGVDVEKLGGEDVDPTGIADLLLQLIAGTIQMPKRILTGSERGELASTQDKATWLGHISERQQNESEPHILRPFLDLLIEHGVLPEPLEERYEVNWPNLFELNEVEQAEVMSKKAQAFKTAATGQMAADLATQGEVRQEILGWGIEVGSETGEVDDVPDQDPFGQPEDEEDVDGGPPGGPPDEAGDIPDDIEEDDDEVREEFRRIVESRE